MPEGDTIYRTAARLRDVVEGAQVTEVSCAAANIAGDALVGRRVVNVEARGKHCLLHFDNRQVLHSHLGMTGSWHLYRSGERWRKPARRAAIAVHFGTVIAVCFSPKVLEMMSDVAFRRHPHLQRLGPDLLAANFDKEAAVQRIRVHGQSTIGEVVMNQTVVCGIGNVYKSEVLFRTKTNPFERVVNLSDARLVEVLMVARKMLHRNLDGSPRRTRFAGDSERLWVYGRSGQPCLVCGALVAMRRQGDQGRSTYWCETCQRGSDAGNRQE